MLGKRFLFALALILISACSDPEAFDRGFHSSDTAYLKEVTEQVQAAGIEVRVGETGMIKYRNRDHEKVSAILKHADAEFHGAEEVKWTTDEHRRYFTEMLEAAKIKYRLEPRADGIWIRWYPRNPEERRELPARVLERVIAERSSTSTPCPSSKDVPGKMPSNLSLNKDAAKARSAC